MKDYRINIFYSEEDGGHIADIPDLVACSAFGLTPDEALQEVQVAKRAWLAAAKKERKPIPPLAYRPSIYQLASLSQTSRSKPPKCVRQPGMKSPKPAPWQWVDTREIN
jgi:predicted RNase H-like HicB family nuclease